MRCGACRAENPDDHRFCSQCGTPVRPGCPGCGADVAADARFCGHCGGSLTPTAVEPAAAVPPRDPAAPTAERRQVCVLFVDLVSFTERAQHRDPEAVRELLGAYFDEARTVVHRYGGTIEKFIGDAVMAVWGSPVAREDDAERAVRAGLDLVDAVAALGDRIAVPGLEARAGVVTGEAAVQLDAVDQAMVAGDVVNTAARVQATADPGQVLVDEVTREASARAIGYAPVGERELRGRDAPVLLHAAMQVVAGSGGAQRFDGLEPPFLGRERDLRMLKELLHDTIEQSRAQLVLVTGGPGVGKSRLGWELFKYVDGIEQLLLWHTGRCLAYGEGIAYWALAEMVRMRFRVAEGDPERDVRAKLDEGLATYVEDPDEREWLRPRLAVLLGVEGVAAEAFDRDALFAGWRLFLERLADHAPVVLVFEDMQDADEGLLDFIDHLLQYAAERPVFVLALARPELHERRPAWGHQRTVTVLHLDRLADERMEAMVAAMVEGLPDPARTALAARAEGIPLFAIETVRMLIDRDVVVPRDGRYVLDADPAALSDLDVPPTLQALVAARLDDLPDRLRRIVGTASVLGQSFTPEALAAVASAAGDAASEDVDGLLRELAGREVLTMRADARSPEAGQYRFVQRVMQTVARQRLSRDDRKVRHLAAAEHLQRTADAGEIAGVIAAHYLGAAEARPDAADAAELRATAVRHLERAGDRARSLAAIEEAQRYYERALALGEGPGRARLAEVAGIAAQHAARFERAEELLREAREAYAADGDAAGVARVASWQAETMLDLGRPQEGADLAKSAWTGDDGSADADAAQLAAAIAMLAVNLPELEEDPWPWLDRAARIAEVTGAWDVLGRALSLKGAWLARANRPVESEALASGTFELARRHGLHYRAAIQALYLAWGALDRDLDEAQRWADECLARSRRSGDQFTASGARDAQAMIQVERGDWDEIDVDALREQWVRANRDGAPDHVPLTLVLLAAGRGDRSLLDGGDPALGLELGTADARAAAALRRAILAGADGEARTALAVLDGVAERLHAHIAPHLGHVHDALLVDVAMALGEHDVVRRVVSPSARRAPDTPVAAAHRAWARARLQSVEGSPQEVDDVFRDAADAFDGLGRPWWRARVLLDHAERMADDGRSADASPAASEALAVFRRLGAVPLAARAARLTEQEVSA